MLVVNRFRLDTADGADTERLVAELRQALALLATRPGYLDGRIGRNVDDPALWVLTTRWDGPGSYRRALSSYDVKVGVVPLLSRALDEPSAYETVPLDGDAALNEAVPRELG